MLQVVSIKNNVIATSGVGTGSTLGNEYSSTDATYAPDRNVFNSWYEGF